MWVVSVPEALNALWHRSHLYGFCPLWILLWTIRPPACVNRLPQKEHSNGFCPEWILLCTIKFELSRKHFPHSLHLYGFSPLWTLLWLLRPFPRANHLPQTEHWNCFFPEWILPCSFMFERLRKHVPHSPHLYGLCTPWVLLCLVSSAPDANRCLQTEHSNGFSLEWIRLCLVKLALHLKHFPHSLHLCLLLWIFICCLNTQWLLKDFSQWGHEYEFCSVCDRMWTDKYLFVESRLPHTVHWGLEISLLAAFFSLTSLLSVFIFSSDDRPPAYKAKREAEQYCARYDPQKLSSCKQKKILSKQ